MGAEENTVPNIDMFRLEYVEEEEDTTGDQGTPPTTETTPTPAETGGKPKEGEPGDAGDDAGDGNDGDAGDGDDGGDQGTGDTDDDKSKDGSADGTANPPGDTPEDVEINPKAYAQAIFELNGWEWQEEFMQENTLDSFNKLVQQIVDANVEEKTKTVFANPELQRFNELVSKGAKIQEAYDALFSKIDYDTIQITGEDNVESRKNVLRKYYKETTKFSDEKIEREIKRKIDLSEDEEEAKEAIKYLKENSAAKDKELEDALEAQREADKAKKLNELEKTKTAIRTQEKIAGFEVDQKTKDEFIKYAFGDGKTQGPTEYQKFIQENPDWNIQAAFLAFKRVNKEKLDAKEETEVVKKLKATLRNQRKDTKPIVSKDNRVTPDVESPKEKGKPNVKDFLL